MPKFRTVIFVLASVLFTSGLVQAAQPSFYLATDRIFSTHEDPIVKIEGREISEISLRIYRVEDPKKFFLRQENPYQVKPDGKRSAGLRQLAGIFLSGVRHDVAETLRGKIVHTALPEKLRSEVKELLKVKDFSGTVEASGYLKDYPLTREVKVKLNPIEDEWSYHFAKLPIFEKGVYLVEGVVGNETGYCVAMVSDLALVARHSADQALFFAADRMTGSPLATKISVFREDGVRLDLKTDSQGLARHQNKNLLEGRSWILAESEGHFTLHDATYYPSSSFGVDSTKCYLYTERPLYQPGQELYFKALIRDYAGGYKLPKLPKGELPVVIQNPAGRELARLMIKPDEWGSVSGEWAIPKDAEPGTWKLILDLAGQGYQAPFKVEHYVKPPFEVNVSLDKPSFSFGEQIKGKVSARYFFGEPVRKANYRYLVYRVERVRSTDPGIPFGWYLQDNQFHNQREELVYEGQGETDSEGIGPIDFNANTKTLKGESYSYRIEVRLSDSERRLVRGSTSFAVNQGLFWLKLSASKEYFTPGEKGEFKVEARDYQGKSITSEYQARVIYYRWTQTRMSNPAERVVKLDKGFELPKKESFSYTFTEAGHYQIEISARDSAGNMVTTHQFVWVAGNANKFLVAESGLRVVTDKKIYSTGESAELLLLSPIPDASVFYTIEGDRIIESGVFKLEGNSLIKKQKITSAMTPNSWLVLNFVFNDRVYTTKQQLLVPPREKFLKLSLEGLKEKYQPGEEVDLKVKVSDQNGKGIRAALSAGVVDRAILSLQPKLVTEIERFFYHPHRNNVIGSSSYQTRFYGYAEEDKLHLASYLRPNIELADMSKGQDRRSYEDSKRTTFKDVAFWDAELRTASDGTARIKFTLPDNITEWNLELVAFDRGDRVGSQRFSFLSYRDFFVRSVIPTFLYENDLANLSATVHNLTASKQNGTLQLKVKNAQVSSAPSQKVSLSARSESQHEWEVRAGQVGKLECEFVLDGFNRDSETREIEVLPFAQTLSESWSGSLAGSDKIVRESFTIPAGAKLETLKGRVRLTPNLLHLAEDALKYLIDYPYGCVEQTLSRFIPNLLVMQMQAAFPFKDEYLKDLLPELTRTGISRLETMQNSDGSWGWFANDQSDIFMTAYAVYGLALARDLGYPSSHAIDHGVYFLNNYLKSENQLNPTDRALVLFALKQVDRSSAELQTMLRIAVNETPRQSHLAQALLINVMLDSHPAREIGVAVENLLSLRQPVVGEYGSFYQNDNPLASRWHDDYNLVDALLLRALSRAKQKPELCQMLIQGLLARRQEAGWRSTMDTAFILSAFIEYSEKMADRQNLSRTSLKLNGKTIGLKADRLGSEAIISARDLKVGENTLELAGDSGLYYSAGLSYYSRQESFAPQGKNMQVNRSWYSIEKGRDGQYQIGKELKGQLPRGKLVLVKLELKTSRNQDFVMIEDPLPAGCEFISESDRDFIKGIRINTWLSHHVLPDRVVFFNRYLTAPSETLYYIARPYLDGEYRVPPTRLASMYYPEFSASGASARLKIN